MTDRKRTLTAVLPLSSQISSVISGILVTLMLISRHSEGRRQDVEVEGLELSHKIPKSQLSLEQPLTKKTVTYQRRYSTSKDKEEAIMRKGHFHSVIKSHTHQVGNPQTGKQLYLRSSPTVVRLLSQTSGSPV